MDFSSNRYIKRSLCEIRLDQRPERLCLSGSGFPKPEAGSFERSISLSNLRKALCKCLSLSRIVLYASQVLPSNTSDLIHLLFSRYIAFTSVVGFKGVGNLLREALALENMKRFLLSFPVVGAYYNESLSGSSSYLEWFMPANYLFYNALQVVSKFVYTYCIHDGTLMYGVSVQVCVKCPNKAKHSDSYSVAASPSLLSRACWAALAGIAATRKVIL